MPNEAYRDDDFFRFERDHVLSSTWVAIGFVDELIKPGYLKPYNFMGIPLLVVRNKQNDIEVFHNVCSHRGMVLVAEEGPAKPVIQCRYHSWCYGLDGALRATPHIGGVNHHDAEGFSREGKGLKPVRSRVWLGMVFVNLSGDAPSFDDFIEPLLKRWEPFVGRSGFDDVVPATDGSQLELEVNCNWKLAVENYCEAYHLPWVHPGLNSYSPLDEHYNLTIGNNASGQGSYKYTLSEVAGTYLPRFAHWPEAQITQAEYVSLYPNVLLGAQVDHVFAIILTPTSASTTHESLRLMYVGQEAGDTQYADCRKAVLEAWREVFTEDIFAIESMQQGRESPAFTGGSFSPVLDGPSHHFHNWVAARYLDAAR
ncbi:MAG: aromatic ring-hydroxylating dioxygenase subunit alpha [Pseudomonadota bacterium]